LYNLAYGANYDVYVRQSCSGTYGSNSLPLSFSIPSCMKPAVSVYNIEQTYASILTNCGGCASEYILEYGLSGFVPGTGATAGSLASTVLTCDGYAVIGNLIPNTDYDVYVRSKCLGVNIFSANSDKAKFKTIGCKRPSAPQIYQITEKTIKGTIQCFDCEDPFIIEYGLAGFVPGTGATAGINGSIINKAAGDFSFTIPNLLSNTTYDVYVRQNCDSANLFSENSIKCPIKTRTCEAPHTVDISGIYRNLAIIYYMSNNQNSPYIVEYGLAGFVPGTGNTAGVGGKIRSSISNYTVIDSLSANTTYDVYVRQICGNQSSDNSYRKRFTTLGCSIPRVISVNSIDRTSAIVSFDCAGCIDEFIIEYGIAGFTPGTTNTAGVGGTINNNNNHISGLQHSQNYDVYVRQKCTAINQYSDNSNKLSFKTLGCEIPDNISVYNATKNAVEVDFYCNNCFDSYIIEYGASGFTPGTTDVAGLGGTTLNTTNTSNTITGLTHSKNYDLYIRQKCTAINSYSNNSYAIPFATLGCQTPQSPIINTVTQKTASLTLNCTGCTEPYIIEYGLAGFTPGTTNVAGAGGTIINTTNLNNLSASSDYDVYVRQKCTSINAYSTNSFKSSFSTLECQKPMPPSIYNISRNSASVAFSCVNCAGSYIIEYGLSGFTPSTNATAGIGGTIINTTSTTSTLNNLLHNQTYDIYVRQVCGAKFGLNSDKVLFTTLGCVAPQAININNITKNAVQYNINCGICIDSLLIEYGAQGFIPGTGNVAGVGGTLLRKGNTTSGLINGLFPSTNYDIYLRQKCTAINQIGNNSLVTSFKTLDCDTLLSISFSNISRKSAILDLLSSNTTSPYLIEYGLAGFTPGTDANAGNGGTVVNSISSNPTLNNLTKTTQYDVYGRQLCIGTMYGKNTSRYSFTTLDCPPPQSVDITNISSNSISLQINCNNCVDSFIVEYGPIGFTPGAGALAGNNGTIIKTLQPNVSITGLGLNQSYAIYVRGNCSVVGSYSGNFYVGDYTTLSCATNPSAPTNLSITKIKATTAELNFNCNNCTGFYLIEFGATGFVPQTNNTAGVGGTLIYSTSLTNNLITGLNASQTYDVYVRQNCSSATNSIKTTFITSCNPTILPIDEGFNLTTLPLCWKTTLVETGTTTPALSYVNSSSNPAAVVPEGTRMLRYNSYFASAGAKMRMTSKPLNTMGIPSVDVSFQMAENNALLTRQDKVTLQYSIDGEGTWIDVAENVRANQQAGTYFWYTRSFTLPLNAGNQPYLKIGLLFTSAQGNNIYVDDFKVFATPALSNLNDSITNTFTLNNVSGFNLFRFKNGASTIAEINPNGMNLGTINLSLLENKANNVPFLTLNNVPYLQRYFKISSTLAAPFATPVSVKLLFHNSELSKYNLETNKMETQNTLSMWRYANTSNTATENCNPNDNLYASSNVPLLETTTLPDGFGLRFKSNYLSEFGAFANDGTMAALKAKVFLNQVNPNNALMPKWSNQVPNFPLNDPYSFAPYSSYFQHLPNTPTAITTNAILAISGNNAIIDWLFLELRTGTPGATQKIMTRAVLLQADGDIVATDGVSPVTFPSLPPNEYYVVIRHRNHLGARTETPVKLYYTMPLLDFTQNNANIYLLDRVQIANNIFALPAGDADIDGSIDGMDSILWDFQNGNFDNYFLNSDYNLDGSIDALDSILWELNNGKYEDLN
jgi:hypothetical protein